MVTRRGYAKAKTVKDYKDLLMERFRIKTDENKEVNRGQVLS